MSNQTSAKALIQQGYVAFQSGDTFKASRLFRRATELDPNDEEAWLALSEAIGSETQRHAFLERVLELNPSHQEAQRRLQMLDQGMALPLAVPVSTDTGNQSILPPANQQNSIPPVTVTLPQQPPSVKSTHQHWDYHFAEFILSEDGYTLITINNQPVGTTTDLSSYSKRAGQDGWELISSVLGQRAVRKGFIEKLLAGSDTSRHNMHNVLLLMFKRPV